MDAGRVYVHIGLMKTGTSFLQSALRAGSAELAEQGVSLVPSNQVAAHRLSLALRGEADGAAAALADLARRLAGATGDRCLITEESLAFAEAHHVDALVGALEGHEAHLVVTVRDVARAVPSAWQQRVKNGRPLGFAEFVEAVMSGRGRPSRVFRETQDVVQVLGRWRHVVPSERTHVVTVPPAGSPADLLLERFCDVLDVDAAVLPPAPSRPNESLGYAQAELLRQVNELLPDDLRGRDPHGTIVKRFLGQQVLAPQGGARALMPPSSRDWCLAAATATIAALEHEPYDVVGDLADLLPVASSYAADGLPPDDAEVHRAAVRAIVALLLDRARSAAGGK